MLADRCLHALRSGSIKVSPRGLAATAHHPQLHGRSSSNNTSSSSCSGASWVCHAESDIVTGPISYKPVTLPVSDSVTAASERASKPVDRSKGLWTRCDKCGVILYIKHLKEHNHICFGCQHHMKMSSMERVEHLIDPGTWRPIDETLSPVDPLEFVDQKPYTDRIKEAQEKTGLQDAVRTGTGLMHGVPIALGVMDFSFMGGSMGSVVGEKLTRLIEYATAQGMSLIIVSTSGGARMQEGIMSLMQMAKISGALHVHQNQANLLFISLLTSPTTGGVTASFGMLGDIILAEPQAIIGFAGRRVIEQTLQENLPDDFQTAEYLLAHGLLDLVVPRSFLKGALYEIINFYKDAPFKRRGSIPYGVQHGTFLTSEERVRRKWLEWNGDSTMGSASGSRNGASLSSGSSMALAQTNGGSVPSTYQELVRSFETLVSGIPGAPGADEAAASIDISDLLGDEVLLSEAMHVARTGRLEWVEQVHEDTVADKTFMFHTAPDKHPPAPSSGPVGMLAG